MSIPHAPQNSKKLNPSFVYLILEIVLFVLIFVSIKFDPIKNVSGEKSYDLESGTIRIALPITAKRHGKIKVYLTLVEYLTSTFASFCR